MRRVQSVALDLFEERGFGGVTIEEIAAAAEVSAPTVYRHFGSKEQLVLWDEYDPLIFEAAAEARGDSLLDALATSLARAVDSVCAADQERILRRARLMRSEPALRQANAPMLAVMRNGLAQSLLASGACEDDLEAEVVAGAVACALETAVRHWEKAKGRKPLGPFVVEAFHGLRRLVRVAKQRPAKSTKKKGTR